MLSVAYLIKCFNITSSYMSKYITISKLNDMMKDKVSAIAYIVLAIYYKGLCLSILYLSELA